MPRNLSPCWALLQWATLLAPASAQITLGTTHGTAHGGWFVGTLASGGDLDGDGSPDLFIGAIRTAGSSGLPGIAP